MSLLSNSYCSGTLICYCSDGYVPDENRTSCLEPLVGGDADVTALTCDTTEYCASHIPSSECSSGACYCVDGYTPSSDHTACQPGRHLLADDVFTQYVPQSAASMQHNI